MTGIQALQSLLSQCNFYGEITKRLSQLYMGSTVDPSGVNGANGWTVESLYDGQVPPDAEVQPSHWTVLYDSSSKGSSSNECEGLFIRCEVLNVMLRTDTVVINIPEEHTVSTVRVDGDLWSKIYRKRCKIAG